MENEGEEAPRRYRLTVKLIRQECDSESIRVCSSRDAYQLFMSLESKGRELFCVGHLNTKHEVIGYEEVSKGTLNASLVHPREAYKAAVLNSTHAIIAAHNHPSGCARPSREDYAVTERLKQAGELLGIVFLDNLIIGENQYYSMAEGRLEHMARQEPGD